jgi:CHAT domain-containing protein/Tfp pilus assembly protein PilF
MDLAALLLLVRVAQAPGAVDAALAPGARLTGSLAAGETRRYSVRLRAGELARAAVDQRGLDVEVVLTAPDGREVATVDSPNDRWGLEPIAWVAERTGDYRLAVRAGRGGAPGATYVVSLDTRPAGPRDRRAAAADGALRDATRAIVSGPPAARRAAIDAVRGALRTLRALGDAAGQARALHLLAFAHRQAGDPPAARAAAEQGLRLLEGDPAGRALCLNELGLAHFAQGELAPAARRFEEVAAACREAGQADCEARALSNQALVAQAGGRLPEAKALDAAALALMGPVEHPQQGVTLNNLGGLHQQLGEPEEALRCFEQALALLRASGRPRAEVDALNNLARLRLQMGEPQEALRLFGEARERARATGHRRGEAAVLANLAELHVRLGAPADALAYLDPALRLFRELGDRRQEAIVLTQLGRALLELGRAREARARLDEAAQVWTAVDDRSGRAFTLCESADVALALDDPVRALEALATALELFRAAEDRPGQAAALDRIGHARLAQGDAVPAAAAFRAALDLRTRMGDRLGRGRTLAGLGEAAAALGDLEEARANLEDALAALEDLRGATLRRDLRVSLVASNRAASERLVEVQMRLHARSPDGRHAAAAFEANERFRARSLLDTLAAGGADAPAADLDPAVAARLVRLDARIQVLADALDPGAGGPRSEAERLGRLDEALRERHTLASEARAASPRYAALVQPRAATLSEIQAELMDADTLLLEYALLPDRSYLWVLDAGALRTFVLPGRRRIEDAVARLRERWQADPDGASSSAAAAELSGLLLGPAAELLGRKRLAVVADGALQALPFGALAQPGAGTPLLLRHEIVSLPSASVLVALRRDLRGRPRADRSVAVFADPVYDAADARVSESAALRGDRADDGRPRFYRLRATRREAEEILALAPAGTRLAALGFEATRERATRPDVAGYRYVHFAAHGLLDTRRPELSGIVLSLVDPGGAPKDGFLRIHEIAGLHLGADLVVLSACETALGADVAGEGLVGLARGFMHAGAPRVVASLWPVSDLATAELMRRFYDAMLRGRVPPAAALRRAQLAIRSDPRWRRPFYWAGFVLLGDWR